MDAVQLVWKKRYEIGVEDIDEQHKNLFNLLRNLQASLSRGSEDQVLGNTLKALVKYTQVHFRDEEALMERIEFPDYENHKQLHKRFIADIRKILIDLKNGRPITAIHLINFIKKWLVTHILAEDAKIGHHHKAQMEEACAAPAE
jgi:hemerythrin-like metal-binding protein